MATIRAVIVTPDGVIRLTDIDNELSAFQQVVGGYIEGVYGEDFTVYVNEEGLLQRLPINRYVTALPEIPPVLVGTALIVGAADEEGYDTDVPDHIIKHYGLEK